MSMKAAAVTFGVSLFLLSLPCRGADDAETLHKRVVAHYDRAAEHFGLAMGERGEEAGSALSLLVAEVAEILCLKGELDGCLEASRQIQRPLGAYAAVLPGKTVSAERLQGAAAFVRELHGLSEGWGLDKAIASEAMGLLEQIGADRLRAELSKSLAPRLEKALAKARRSKDFRAWLKAGRLARLKLDQQAQVEVADALAKGLAKKGGAGLASAEKQGLAAILRRGRDMLAILGQADDPAGARMDAGLKLLDSKALAVPDLEFELAPSSASFKSDLEAAARQLSNLAKIAPLRSRPSILFGYLSAYAGLIRSDPAAADPLLVRMETMVLTDPYLAIRARGLLGRQALLEGDYHRAAQELETAALGLQKIAGCESLRGLLAANRAQALFYLARYDESAQAFSAALPLLVSRPKSSLQVLLGSSHALLFGQKADQAASALKQAEVLLEKIAAGQRDGLQRQIHLERALAQASAGQLEAAVAGFERVATSAREAGDVRAAAIALTNLAELHNDRGEAKKALSQAQGALKWLDEASQADARWQALCEKGRALAALNEAAQAEKAFARSMDLVEKLRARIGAEGSKRSFSAAKQRLYRAALSQLVSAGRTEQAFWVSERARGRAFLDMLGERRLQLGDPKQQAKLDPARTAALAALPPMTLTLQGPGESLAKAGIAQKAAKALATDPRAGWLSLVTVNPAGVADVKKVLRPKEGLVSFFHDGSQLQVFLVSRKGIVVRSSSVDTKGIKNRVTDMLRQLKKPSRTDKKARRKGERLYKVTLAPLAKELAKLERLVIVPWGPLHYIPFAALHDSKAYLIDTHEVSVVPSASALVMIRSGQPGKRRKLNTKAVLALGNPVTDMEELPAAELEADLLGQLFRGAQVHKREKATKKTFISRASRAQLVHLASHGVFLPERPMESYLALSGPEPEKGHLTALDVLGTNLGSSRLVVLSACHSGEVNVEAGDEIIGLTRAFLHAGAPALVASLWPLSDETALEFVGRFYKGLKKGQSPSTALTKAIRELKADERYSHPFFWAPYSLIGS